MTFTVTAEVWFDTDNEMEEMPSLTVTGETLKEVVDQLQQYVVAYKDQPGMEN